MKQLKWVHGEYDEGYANEQPNGTIYIHDGSNDGVYVNREEGLKLVEFLLDHFMGVRIDWKQLGEGK
jgi:hypothetical protein